MKVKELIAYLKTLDQEKYVLIGEDSEYPPMTLDEDGIVEEENYYILY